MMKRGFSLLEVLFSVAFLTIVGLGIIALNVSSLRLVVDSETKTLAYALNDETIAHLRLLIERLGPDGFREVVNNDTEADCDSLSGCYLSCPADLNESCSLVRTPSPVQIGRSRLTFVRNAKISEAGLNSGKFLVRSSTSWGTGISRSIQANYFLEKL